VPDEEEETLVPQKNDAERERVCVSVQLCYGLTHSEVTQCGCRVQGQKQNNEAVTAGDD